ncbi:alpha/beta hydrolase [Streptomyces rugosispiralis]|uniref:Alpha/beta hydrolase n=1 Tax=Streptomyces rugosispiralis TaxID=2967341 RepID=A0ABT1URZ9_9ACTN|nr:alpha/beta hydrolase [Streptomyces rugosispiralis]MCQ8187899.1 alpha/beta hydrolase [Streptomyces rugosispiralis]
MSPRGATPYPAVVGAVRPSGVTVHDHYTQGGLRLRVYRTAGTDVQPLILLFHSGGFVHGRPETEEARALRYATDVGAVVVSVDYRHAPEHPYPAAVEDAYAGLLWAVEHATELGADPRKLAVAGCSAGGALAAATALRARDTAGPAIRFQLLIYPGLDDRLDTPSARDFTGIPVLTRFALRRVWDYYRPDGAPDGYAAPARAADLTGLPPTLMVVAEVGPVRDENIAYAARLSRAGVDTELVQVPGAVHGVDLMFAHTAIGERGLATQVRALREALHR